MQYFFTKKFDGTFTMSWVGSPTYTDEISTHIRDVKTFTITPTKSIKTITNFSDIVKGENTQHYFQKSFTYSNLRSGVSFSEPAPITGITGEYCPLNDLYVNLIYNRIDKDINVPTLTINAIVIDGTYDIEITDEIIEVPDDGYILEPKNIYKIFKLTGYEIYGVNTNNLEIKYRFTQDNGRTYTPWEPISTENISTIKLNPVRFAQVQYSITKINNSITSKIYDIILLGDFQNINNYYLKTNRYGVRDDCAVGGLISGSTNGTSSTGMPSVCLSGRTSYMGENTSTGGKKYDYNRDWITQGLSCYLTGNIITSLNGSSSTIEGGSSATYNPYSQSNQQKITNWYNYLANSVGNIFGWTVEYNLTDPDGHGIDRYLHEYQLFNIVDMQKIKIIVPENQFPDNQVQFSEYMMDMVDVFKIIILKDEFQRAFGIEKRPAQKDIIFFCQANRLYRIRHAQIKRDIMYQGFYYDIVLEKYEKLGNEQNLSNASKDLIDSLTNNNTLDSLFGDEMRSQENKVVNKQLKPTTHQVYRLNLNPKVSIIKKDIYNSLEGTKIADNYYNLSSLTPGLSAITYSYQDSILEVSDNRAINLWFNFNNLYDSGKSINEDVFKSYNVTKNYEFLNNYDDTNKLGYKINVSNKQIILTVNNSQYALSVPNITTNIWYGLTLNIDNRQRKISLDLYKRNYSYNITMFTNNYQSISIDSQNTTGITYYTSIGYRPVKNTEINAVLTDTSLFKVANIEYSGVTLNNFEIDKIITIPSSDIKLTNIRIFNNVIPEEEKSNILLQRVVQESQYLILADNATKELYTSNILNTRWE